MVDVLNKLYYAQMALKRAHEVITASDGLAEGERIQKRVEARELVKEAREELKAADEILSRAVGRHPAVCSDAVARRLPPV